MDASINRSKEQDFRIAELRLSSFTEDQELAVKARKVTDAILRTLKPLLKYLTSSYVLVCGPQIYPDCNNSPPIASVRAVQLGIMSALGTSRDSLPMLALFLDEEGLFFSAEPCKIACAKHYHYAGYSTGDPQEECLFGAVIESLQCAIETAIEKREKHLASIKERSEKLNEILAILKR